MLDSIEILKNLARKSIVQAQRKSESQEDLETNP